MNNNSEEKTGYLLIAHGAMAHEMLNALEFIAGSQDNFKAVAIDHALEVDKARQIIMSHIDELMTGGGVIVLTDLFGGAPSNLAMSILDEKEIEIVAGMNLPMLIYATTLDDRSPIKEKAERLRDYGKNNIFVASEVLSGKKKPA